jgi:hypothetical protein
MSSGSSKRGNVVLEVIVIFALLFVVAVSWLTVHYIQKELNTDIQADETFSAEAKAINQDVTDMYPRIFDKGILFFLMLFWGLSILASILPDVHPAFAIFSIILLILYMSVLVALSNTFYEIFTEDLTGLSGDFPFTFFIFNHLLEIGIVISFTIFLSMFAKPRQ